MYVMYASIQLLTYLLGDAHDLIGYIDGIPNILELVSIAESPDTLGQLNYCI